jgi:hypothetical protein
MNDENSPLNQQGNAFGLKMLNGWIWVGLKWYCQFHISKKNPRKNGKHTA